MTSAAKYNVALHIPSSADVLNRNKIQYCISSLFQIFYTVKLQYYIALHTFPAPEHNYTIYYCMLPSFRSVVRRSRQRQLRCSPPQATAGCRFRSVGTKKPELKKAEQGTAVRNIGRHIRVDTYCGFLLFPSRRSGYSNSSSSAGRSTICCAPLCSSSARVRKPHVTPAERTPAAAAVCISTPESPT